MSGAERPAAGRLRWWREVLYILAFYSVYTFIRNEGVATDSRSEAFRNARQIIRLEERLGTFHEEAVQDAFLPWEWFVRFWNIFYGTAHFVVTVVALVYLFRRMSGRYPLWRNTLAFTTGLALIGFAFYPLMPPRLLPHHYGFVDTLKDVGGLWSFDSGAVAKISNQYAAMPSLHFAWSTWCALVLLPALRRRWQRAVMIAYPALTLFAIVVTANHFWLDAAGGAVTLGAGFLLGSWFTRVVAGRDARRRTPVGVAVGADEAGAEPAAATPEPAVAEPVVPEPEPVVPEPEPVVPEPEPVVAEPEPVVAEPEPVVPEPEPAVAEPVEPVVLAPEPASPAPEAAVAEPVVPEPVVEADPAPDAAPDEHRSPNGSAAPTGERTEAAGG